MKRVLNFSAGPSAIPLDVLKTAQEQLLDFNGFGLSIMEGSHRAKMFEDVHNEAIELIIQNYNIPNNFKVLFVQGGASLQFAMVPMNLKKSGLVQYVDTGIWSSKAIKEAQIQNLNVQIVASSKQSSYDHIPQNINFSDEADYGYITSNNTIYGTQYKEFPTCKNLIIDASSDIFSYEIDWSKVGILYAGAQKNAGPSGVSIVIIKDDLIQTQNAIPSMLKYENYANSNSMYNTPPTFSIYMLNLTMKWLKNQGGIKKIQAQNEKKAKILYECIDNSSGFYKAHAKVGSRSNMNVSFNIFDEKLQDTFLEQAVKNDMIGLKGHRILGGLRASIYNAITLEQTEILRDFMLNFAKKYN